jgi:putative ABC transport system ATP-binding protein
MDILKAEQLTKTYFIEDREVPVLDQVSVSVTGGEFIIIEGKSGSGKTTLLSLLSGLDKPTSGSVYIEGKEITHLGEDDLAPFRNQTFGFVFQSFHLVPSLSAIENIMFPAELNRDPDARGKAEQLLEQMDLTHRRYNLPSQLSGGEKQRVAICRAFINQPKIIFADEPTGNLDSKSGEAIMQLLIDVHRKRHATILLVTHRTDMAAAADRTIYLEDGRNVGEKRNDTQIFYPAPDYPFQEPGASVCYVCGAVHHFHGGIGWIFRKYHTLPAERRQILTCCRHYYSLQKPHLCSG